MASPSNAESVSLLKDLLRRARADGSLDSLVASILAEPEDGGFELLEGQQPKSVPAGMSDASKRRMTELPEREYQMSGPNEQKKVGTSPHSFGLTLPDGVADVGEWGLTVLEVRKYGKMGMSYMELSASGSQAHQSYCAWLLTQKFRVDLTSPMKDFVRYLMVREAQTPGGGACFEGSTVPRKLKSK